MSISEPWLGVQILVINGPGRNREFEQKIAKDAKGGGGILANSLSG